MSAQDPGAEPAPPKAKAKAAGKAAAGGRPSKSAALAPPEDPVVVALLASNPTTPSEIFRTAQLLLQAGRPELAKKFYRRLLDAKPDEGQWSALVEEYRTTAFTDLASRAELRPENEAVIQAALGAFNRRLQDPQRIAGHITQLQDPSPEVRARAMAQLRGGHETAVKALIAVLADPQRAGEHAAVRGALIAMRGEAIDPLADMIERADPEFTAAAIETLAEMRAQQATIYLYVPALADESDVRVKAPAQMALRRLMGYLPSKEQAAGQLAEQARSYFAGKQAFRTDVNGRVTLWTWDADAKHCVSRNCSPDDAARAFAARLARAARALAPENRSAQVLALATEMEQIVYDRGLDKPLDFKSAAVKDLAAVDARLLEDSLAFCLAQRHPAAARAAAEILGRSGKAHDLLREGDAPSPLVRAVESPDPRLRIAAAEAIVRLQPKGRFAGASHVPRALAYQAASSGGRRALAVSPNASALNEWMGVLKSRNIEPDMAVTGRDALRTAQRCPDYELVVIDMATQGPPAEEVVQRLRQDCRTSQLRVALVARAGFLKRAERIAEEDPLAIAFSQPIDAAATRWQLDRLNALVPREFVGFSERQALAVRALDCLASLTESTAAIDDVQAVEDAVLTGLKVPRLSSRAILVLANLSTRVSQQALLDLANRAANPLAVRKAAAAALDINVQRFGLLVDVESIRRQYRRYNDSAAEDKATQQVLAGVLNTIESRAVPSVLEAARKAAQPVKATPPGKPPAKAGEPKK